MGNCRPPVWIVLWAQLRGDPKKTAVLIVLAFVMVGVYVRLFFRKSPQQALAADIAVAIVPPTITTDVPTTTTVTSETRVHLDRPLVRTLNRDPFTLGSVGLEDDSNVDGPLTNDTRSLNPLQRIRNAASEMVLECTVVGSKPIASINGRVVRPNDTIDGFVLERIEPTKVVLRRHDIRVELSLKNTRE